MQKIVGWMEFVEMCLKAQSVEQLSDLLDLFLTIEEKEQLASRYRIIQALLEGRLTQRAIAKESKVSIAQITRGSNALKIIDPKMKTFLKRHLR